MLSLRPEARSAAAARPSMSRRWGGLVRAGVPIRRGDGDAAERDDRAALGPESGRRRPRRRERRWCPRSSRRPARSPHSRQSRAESAAHARHRLRDPPCLARSAPRRSCRAWASGAAPPARSPGIARDVDGSARHAQSDVVAHISVDDDLALGQAGAERGRRSRGRRRSGCCPPGSPVTLEEVAQRHPAARPRATTGRRASSAARERGPGAGQHVAEIGRRLERRAQPGDEAVAHAARPRP